MTDLLQWFAGGDTPYMRLTHCMSEDTPWIVALVVARLLIFAGYCYICGYWYVSAKHVRDQRPRSALKMLAVVFWFCGLSGYLLPALSIVWPAYRLLTICHWALVAATLAFCCMSLGFRAVLEISRRNAVLEHEIEVKDRTLHRTRDEIHAAVVAVSEPPMPSSMDVASRDELQKAFAARVLRRLEENLNREMGIGYAARN